MVEKNGETTPRRQTEFPLCGQVKGMAKPEGELCHLLSQLGTARHEPPTGRFLYGSWFCWGPFSAPHLCLGRWWESSNLASGWEGAIPEPEVSKTNAFQEGAVFAEVPVRDSRSIKTKTEADSGLLPGFPTSGAPSPGVMML